MAATETRYCANCGERISARSRFCPACGARQEDFLVADAEPVAAPPAPTPPAPEPVPPAAAPEPEPAPPEPEPPSARTRRAPSRCASASRGSIPRPESSRGCSWATWPSPV